MKSLELEKLLIKTLTEAYMNEYRKIQTIVNKIIIDKRLKILGLYPLISTEIAFCSCKDKFCAAVIPYKSKKYAMLFHA